MNPDAQFPRAAAPGKVVISGAYVVLEGAPAIVAAVDRYVVATLSRPASYFAKEVSAALEAAPYQGYSAPDYDVSALREGDRKLGLGSSAAILAASLAALPPTDLESAAGRQALFEHALNAHRKAQGGGSGIDVAASTFGGTLRFQLASRAGEPPHVSAICLPPSLHVEVWSSPRAAETREFLKSVRAFGARDPKRHAEVFAALARAAEAACAACDTADPDSFLSALKDQAFGLGALGQGAQIPIVTPELQVLTRLSEQEGAVLIPAGAGGGDIALWVSHALPSPALRRAQHTHAHETLVLKLGARGVHRLP